MLIWFFSSSQEHCKLTESGDMQLPTSQIFRCSRDAKHFLCFVICHPFHATLFDTNPDTSLLLAKEGGKLEHGEGKKWSTASVGPL